MSADNCIAILHTVDTDKQSVYTDMYGYDLVSWSRAEGPLDAWRVAHVQGLDGFDWYKDNQLYMLGKYMYDMWGKSEVFYTREEAKAAAEKEFQRVRWTEYGTVEVDATEFSFT